MESQSYFGCTVVSSGDTPMFRPHVRLNSPDSLRGGPELPSFTNRKKRPPGFYPGAELSKEPFVIQNKIGAWALWIMRHSGRPWKWLLRVSGTTINIVWSLDQNDIQPDVSRKISRTKVKQQQQNCTQSPQNIRQVWMTSTLISTFLFCWQF